jgi:hypothetical protein
MNSKMIPGLSVNEGLDFVKRVWGSLPIPSVITPTTDVEELDKRINDLRAVEQWLNVNLSMLRATIQGLEVQRGTIATLKSFGNNLGIAKPAAPKPEERSDSGFSDALGNLGAGLVGAVGAIAAGHPLAGSSSAEPKSAAASLSAEQLAAAQAAAAQAAEQGADPVANALIANASTWWSALQDQFNRVAGAAISGAGLTTPATDAEAASKPKAKRTVSAAKATKPARSSSAIVKKPAAAKAAAPRKGRKT